MLCDAPGCAATLLSPPGAHSDTWQEQLSAYLWWPLLLCLCRSWLRRPRLVGSRSKLACLTSLPLLGCLLPGRRPAGLPLGAGRPPEEAAAAAGERSPPAEAERSMG